MIRIDRCLCHDRTFEELAALARTEQLALDALQARTGCGTGCGLCLPYLRRMLASGHTVFHELLAEERDAEFDDRRSGAP